MEREELLNKLKSEDSLLYGLFTSGMYRVEGGDVFNRKSGKWLQSNPNTNAINIWIDGMQGARDRSLIAWWSSLLGQAKTKNNPLF